jgi:hypothetical protein
MGTSNTLGLLFEIAADPSKAEGALDSLSAKVQQTAQAVSGQNQTVAATAQSAADAVNTTQQAMRRTIADSLQMQGASAKEAEQIYQQMGLSGQQAAAEIKAAFGSIPPSINQSTQAGAGSIREMFPALTELRQVTRLAFGAFAVGFIIEDMGKVCDAIEKDSLALGGFSTAAQENFDKAAKAYDSFMEHLHGANYTRALLKDTNDRIAAAKKQIDELTRSTQGMTKSADQMGKELSSATGALGGESTGFVGGVADAGKKLADLENTLTDLNAQQTLLSAQLAQEVVAHGKAAKAVKDHKEAVKDLTEQQYDYWQKQRELDQQAADMAAKLAQEQEKFYVQGTTAVEHAMQAETSAIMKSNEAIAANIRTRLDWRIQINTDAASIRAIGAEWGEYTKSQKQQSIDRINAQRQEALQMIQTRLVADENLAAITHDYAALARAELAAANATTQVNAGANARIAALNKEGQSVRGLTAQYNSMAQQVRTAISQMTGQLTGWGGLAARVFDQTYNQIARQIEIEKLEAAEHKISQFSMMTATIDALKQTAEVQAAMEAAKGFAALAEYDYWASAQHFAAAALYGAVSAFEVASIAGAFGGGGSSAAAGVSQVQGPNSPSTASGSASSGTQQAMAIKIEGLDPSKLYTGQQLTNLINAINGALQNGSATLVIRTPVVRRS